MKKNQILSKLIKKQNLNKMPIGIYPRTEEMRKVDDKARLNMSLSHKK